MEMRLLNFLKTAMLYNQVLGFKGIRYTLRALLSKSKHEVFLRPPHIKYPLFVRMNSSDVQIYKHIFLDKEYDIQLKNSPKTIIDAGANVGYASIYFANLFPQSLIYSIEPESNNFSLLKRNTAPYQNIIPIKAALWKEETVLNLIDPRVGDWGFRTVNDSLTSSRPIVKERIMGITMDKLMADYSIDSIDLLKMDIEGAEKDVLENSSSWVNKIDVLLIELHDRAIPGCSQALLSATKNFECVRHEGEDYLLVRKSSRS